MGMFSGCHLIVRSVTAAGRKVKKDLGDYDDVSSEAGERAVCRRVASGKYLSVSASWEKPWSDDAYTVCYWENGRWDNNRPPACWPDYETTEDTPP